MKERVAASPWRIEGSHILAIPDDLRESFRPGRPAYLAARRGKKVVGTNAWLVHDGEVLLVHAHHRIGWSPPGGFVDAHEAPPDALRREVHEETGLEIEVGPLLAAFSNVADDTLALLFQAALLGKRRDPEPRDAEEVLGAAWVPLEKVEQILSGKWYARLQVVQGLDGRFWVDEGS